MSYPIFWSLNNVTKNSGEEKTCRKMTQDSIWHGHGMSKERKKIMSNFSAVFLYLTFMVWSSILFFWPLDLGASNVFFLLVTILRLKIIEPTTS